VSHGRFQNPVQATLTGLKDLVGPQPLAKALRPDMRLDGRTVLVTGASSGLGLAVAHQAAERGARVLMVSRSGIPEKGDEVRRRSGNDLVEQIEADLSDLTAIERLADLLRDRGERIDVLVDNAGVATPRARKTAQGLDAMFVTNFLGKVLLSRRLLADGTIRNATYAGRPPAADEPRPRIIYVSSDSHRGASAIDWSELGRYDEYGVNKGIHNYSYFKLVLNTWAVELAKRLQPSPTEIDVAVHVMCPGPVNTNILRDAPGPLKLFMKAIFTAFFRDPEVAARPVLYMTMAPDFERETGRYLHMFIPKRMDAKCYDGHEGARLWDAANQLLAR
jgi:NAD(P)-dependent dehydrogenase (short-subunit alcohol dehydrogenase family)